MDRTTSPQEHDLVRSALRAPEADAYLSADALHRAVRNLETRLAGVQARGGAYGAVELSSDVRDLLVRLEAGAALSGTVH